MMSEILPLELKNVCFRVDTMPLIKDMNLRIESARRVLILGPNGAGKSLLLRICHGLVRPSEGQVIWHGDAVDPARHQAMVFQRPVMLRRSVRANVAYALTLRGIDARHRRDIVDEALERTGIRRLADRSARTLSFGEQQKLAFSRIWALKPKVLFLDEPTASLDPSATHVIENVINAIHALGTTIVMVSHDFGQAERLADEVLFLHRGRLLEQSPAKAFFKEPKNDLAQAFMNGKLLWWRRGSGPRRDPIHNR
ncbi:energy-coupling factor ABC transporter ATP-binding protein [Varunaivibrio sulfuroxidans]|uniref:Amino acid ABC transporter ATP-binding protein (PAAT family) n=1 Tax=Varunaivibrio sulfuroxidans TaxID=1773489 RepID=A0A4R3J6N4_9PROT|nr:ATP-binding cassette domain-containing protein [Varunaivibrio sulfuroxidans]TCS61005.1 amino acid ABC transporter ATP-binding protein (PAAT family) [Varunaivibrio sulfuroxidans]WES31589.1 ATP-binding cassette domain-containing protein [Varunaivibrio sulfuroxidans]